MSRYCMQCKKSSKACICSWITPLQTDIELIILQHPTEVKHPMGTARILSLALSSCQIIVGEDFSHNDQVNALLAQQGVDHYILYPSADSYAIEHIQNQGQTNKKRIFLLDGTWKKAFKIWQSSTNLHGLPTIALPEGLTGHYRIRKASNPHFLSTVEAGFHLLQRLDNQQDYQSLLRPFERMIQFQIDQMPNGVFERNYSPKE